MTTKQVYFGNRNRMVWVPAPAFNADISTVGWSSVNQYLNGGAGVVSSGAAHKEYNLSWNLATQDEIYGVVDYYTNIYGNGLVYFLDPFAARSNAFPSYLAAPGLATIGDTVGAAPSLRVDQPAAAVTPANNYGYPIAGASYPAGNTGQTVVWLPVPQGYKIALGVTGSGTGLMRYQWDGGAATNITYLSVTSGVRANLWLTPPVGAAGISILMPTSGTVTVYGMFAQIVQDSSVSLPSSIANGNFVSGKGHSGLRFAAAPSIQGYSSVMDKVSATARLVEVGAWER